MDKSNDFTGYFFKMVGKGLAHSKAYELTEMRHILLHGRRKYSSLKSFKNTIKNDKKRNLKFHNV